MSKTIKELANELGISKQAVSKKLTANFRANHVTTVTTNGRQQLVIDDDGVFALKSQHIANHNQPPTANQPTTNVVDNNVNLVDELKNRILAQENELSQKNKQILAKDTQLENMQKLLDQSQQLQLMAENKLKKLEPPHNDTESGSELADDQTHERAPEAPVKAESSPEQPPSFWQRLFGARK
ncbi:replication protein B [Lacticaseibacillus paracasei]|jgi:DNA-binding transcriptional regulator GbsR (MarR family)|uniref:replication protein B n=1 Tax=Lacticaseibacillus paracasei TaxID=1597 RepID=UPI000E0998E8|nr:replication protein B [Lacticaseibacillus paracasei]RDG21690.1 replication protein B [Lacticaseibacillus paracasei]